MATDSSILTWEILWTEGPGGLQSVGSQKSGTQLSNQQFHFLSSFTYLPQTTIAKIREVSFLFCTYSRGVGMCLRRCDASGHCRSSWVPSALCAQGQGAPLSLGVLSLPPHPLQDWRFPFTLPKVAVTGERGGTAWWSQE